MHLLIIIPGFVLNTLFGGSGDKQPTTNKIIWQQGTKVSLECFQAIPDASSFAKSYSNSGVEMTYTCKSQFFQPFINAYFDCGQAWIKEPENCNLLILEQLKFDIAHYHAIKLRKKISGLVKPCSMKPKEIEAMVVEINQECREMQLQAEQMSEFGKEMSILEMWSLKIKIEIETMVSQNKNRGLANN